jgi:flagellar basal-body rod protein FlgC
MSFLDAFNISASGLSAERLRINVISSNIANINVTRTKEGGPYKRKDVLFEAVPLEKKSFDDNLKEAENLEKVKVTNIVEDKRPPIMKYDPSHPDADENGYVAYPNINIMEEMVNLINASRSYEANVTTMKASKDMAMKAIEILRV